MRHLGLLGMMETPRPIDGDVSQAGVYFERAVHRTASCDAAKFEEVVEYRAIVAHAEARQLRRMLLCQSVIAVQQTPSIVISFQSIEEGIAFSLECVNSSVCSCGNQLWRISRPLDHNFRPGRELACKIPPQGQLIFKTCLVSHVLYT